MVGVMMPVGPAMYRILIIDDEQAILIALRTYLGGRGFVVEVATDLETAESLVVANEYDAVLTDLRLTGRSGTEGLEIIRFVRENLPRARTILLTAYGSPAVEAQATALGVDLYVQKPIALSKLEQLIRDVFAPMEMNQE
jgi:DNA-binding response OmpR family regulator